MERRKQKAINFDLDTIKMRGLSIYPEGYRSLKKTFRELGFSHRQGSGYISKEKLDSDQVNDIICTIVTKNPWLKECVKKIDVTDIGRQHDMTLIVKQFEGEEDIGLVEEYPKEDVSEGFLPFTV